MALTDESTGGIGATMLVQPSGGIGNYGYPVYAGNNNGGLFGGGDSWLGILFLIALCNGGFGGFGGFGNGWGAMGMMNGMYGMGIDYLYPWLNNSEHISDGFRDQQLSTQIGNIQNAVTSGFGDVQTALCGGFAGVNQNISQGFANTNLGMCQGFNGVTTAVNSAQNAIAQQMYTNQIADMERSFAAQTQAADCCCKTQTGIADLKYTIATEECATRNASAMNTRDIIDANTRGNQAILDKLCQLELDNYKNQLDTKNDTIAQLRSDLLYARGQASQDVQTARILAGQTAEVDALYNRLNNCPVSTVPVYGRQPIFTCNNNGCGCGCNG